MASVRLAHRELILTGRGIVRGLMAEVIALSDPDMQDRLEKALDAIAAAQEEGGITKEGLRDLINAVNRATGSGARAGTIAKLATAAEKLLGLERQAFDLDDPSREKVPELPPDRALSPAEHYLWLCKIRAA